MSEITKKALSNSLKKLMKEKPLSKITVNDVVNDCGVNRRTLYYYFHDIYELLEWTFITEIKEVIGENKTYKTWQKGYYFLLLNKIKK
ncbi:TetR family transcriptional regulator [Marinitoga aeolica]|uniref:TetR family transcriptional regulator n=1 Tax=Marinitoga aeolica TaxID=2809031 RepID=A0ABY8PSX3_9BACT|nr:TetR family transcriptional regulator [Marinitoga aeolica]WGS65735.1 TetR family transcriptional regulator [Marinitoga aeolica]